MNFLRLTCAFIFMLGYLQTTTGLRCFSCKNVDSNRKCRRTVQCWGGATACENVVRMENGILRISKGCQQLTACAENSRQNRYQCSPAVRSLLASKNFKPDRNAPPSVCRSCCNSNKCNGKLFLQEARTGPRVPGQNSWRTVQPSITNVKVKQLSPTSAFITFRDTKGHSSDFFSVKLQPSVQSVEPVVLEDDKLPGTNVKIPNGTLAFLAVGLSAGVQYRSFCCQFWWISMSFLVHVQLKLTAMLIEPRPPSALRATDSQPTSIRFAISVPRFGNRDRVNYYAASYRKSSDSPRQAKRIPNAPYAGARVIKNLEPGTEYVISAWTNVVDSRGRRIASSKPISINAFTGVLGVRSIEVESVRSTSIRWSFRVSLGDKKASPDQFIVSVRDTVSDMLVREETLRNSRVRSYTANGLIPGSFYILTIKAQSRGRESASTNSVVTKTLIRCYSCDEAASPEDCTDFVECPAESDGCVNVVRRLPLSRRNQDPDWYRATMTCTQPDRDCNATRNNELAELCSGSINDPNAPEICSCCCDGDLCNGFGNECGHVFQWLGRLRAPPRPTSSPPFCQPLHIENGEVSCSNEAEIGSTCTFRCTGNRYAKGEDTLHCFNTGRWSSAVPQCVPLETCSEILSPPGTNVRCSNGFNARSICRISCDEGYLNPGESAIRCSHSGQWSADFIPKCLLINKCQPNPCKNGATCHPVPSDYECECVPGFTGRNCGQEVVCDALTAPENGEMRCNNSNKYLSRCRFSCDIGHEHHGSLSTSCLADGYWKTFEPVTCIIKKCDVPPTSLVNQGQSHCTGHEYGDFCNFTCPTGLSVAGGPPSVTCQANELWSGRFPCCDIPCPPHAKVDLYFLLDSSSSLGRRNWDTLINFTIAVMDQFSLGPNDMQVGVGRYNYFFDTESEIQFGDYNDYNDLKRKLYKMPYNGGGTQTGAALKHVYDHSFSSERNREDAPDILIIITDGKSNDDVKRPGRLFRRKPDTTVYAVGVKPNTNERLNYIQLLSMASSRRYVHIIEDGYEQLAQTLGAALTEDVCWIPCQFQYNSRELAARQRPQSTTTGPETDNGYSASNNVNSSTTANLSTRLPIPIDPLSGAKGPAEIEEENVTPEI